MTTMTNNNMRGVNVKTRFFTTGNKEVALNHLSFNINEDATEGADDICGEDTDDPYTVHNHWEVTFEGTQKNLDLLKDFLDNIEAKKTTGENPGVVSFTAKALNGVTYTYAFTGVTRKPIAMSAGGRAAPFKTSTGFKAKTMKATS